MTDPDHITDAGVPVWMDVSDEDTPCAAAGTPTDGRGHLECFGTAERRYGDHAVCGRHLNRGRTWAHSDATEAAADSAAAAHFERTR